MTIGWYLVPNVTRASNKPGFPRIIYCAMDDNTTQIQSDGGDWSNTEVLGGRNIVKVRAADATLATLDALYLRIPVTLLDDTLASLTTAQKNRIHLELNNMGYSDPEITAALGNFSNIGSKTLRQLLNFVATRRQVVRYDAATDSMVYDGAIVLPTPVAVVDAAVQ